MEVKGPIGQAESLARAKSITLKTGCILLKCLFKGNDDGGLASLRHPEDELEEEGGGVEAYVCFGSSPVVSLRRLDRTRDLVQV